MRDEDADELREEEKQRRFEQRYIPQIDPRDPNFVEPEEEE